MAWVWLAAPLAWAAPVELPVAATCPALVTLKAGRFSELAAAADGRVWLFPVDPKANVWLWANGAWQPAPGIRPEARVRHVLPRGPGEWLLLTCPSATSATVLRFDGTTLAPLYALDGKFSSPTLHAGADGMLWVLSRQGLAYGLRGEERVVHELGTAAERATGYFQLTVPQALEVPGQGTWFWSFVQMYASYGMRTFDVWRAGAWTRVPAPAPAELLPGGYGGVVLRPDGTLFWGRINRTAGVLDPATGVQTAQDLAWPADEGAIWLHRSPEGRELAIVSQMAYVRQAPVHNGWRGLLLDITGGTMHVLMEGVDLGRGDYDTGRPVVDTAAGTVLGVVGGGLVLVPTTGGGARWLDWPSGVPLPTVTRLHGSGDRLLALDPERGFAVLSLAGLVRPRPAGAEPGGWEEVSCAVSPCLAPDGSVWYVTASVPGDLVRRTGSRREVHAMAGLSYPVEEVRYLTVDSRGRPWLVGQAPASRVALLDSGEWRCFESVEDAYRAAAAEAATDPSLRVGAPTDPAYPAFSGDGRAAYMAGPGQMRVFDGSTWAGVTAAAVGGASLRLTGLPFFADGCLVVSTLPSARLVRCRDGVWEQAPADVVSPYPVRLPTGAARSASFPGKPSTSGAPGMRLVDNVGTVWAGTWDELYRGFGDTWIRVPTVGTPLCMGAVSQVRVDRLGGLWFDLPGTDGVRVAHLPVASGAAPTAAWVDPPPATVTGPSVSLAVTVSAKPPPALLAWRLDGGDWQAGPAATAAKATLAVDGLRNGRRECEVRVFDGWLRSSPVLRWAFEVKRDYVREVEQCLALLRTGSAAQRQQVAQALLEIGSPALPAVEAAAAGLPAAARATLESVARRIRAQQATTAR